MIYSATGHREISDIDKCNNLIDDYLARNKVDLMIIGCAKGFDTAVGWACVRLAIPFDMYLPFEGSYYDKELRKFARQFKQISEGRYEKQKFWIRDKAMVDDSERTIAWWDGRSIGGTYITKEYAISQNKEVVNIYESNLS